MTGQKIKIDFPSRMKVESQQQLFTRYSDNEKPPGRSLHWRLDRAITSTGMTGSKLLLARALALHMRQDHDGIWFAHAKRISIMETAAVKSVSTYKKHMPSILAVLGIRTERTGHAIRFVWPVKGQDQGNGATTEAEAFRMEPLPPVLNQSTPEFDAIAKKLLAAFGPILKRVGILSENTLTAILGDTCSATPRSRSLMISSPWKWLAHLEARLEADLDHPAEYAAMGVIGLSSVAQPDPGRVDELRDLYESIPDEPNIEENVG